MANAAIENLRTFLRQADMTDLDRLQNLLDDYKNLCIEYNEAAGKIQEFLDRGMVMEASQLLSDTRPPLQEQLRELRFPERDELMMTLEIYELPPLLELNTQVFKNLNQAIAGSSDVMPLINKYRQIARGKDTGLKLNIARQICELDQKNDEWRRTVLDLETIRKDELISEAKFLIQSGNFTALSDCEIELNGDWQVPVRPEILKKIRETILQAQEDAKRKREEQRKEALRKRGENLIQEINQLYSEGQNFEQLRTALNGWDLLCKEDGYTPAETEVLQANGARTALENYDTEKEKDQQYTSKMSLLEDVFRHNGEQQRAEQLYYELQMLGREIPEETARRYQSFCQAKQSAASRRKKMTGVFLFVLLLIVFGSAFVIFKKVGDRRIVTRYSSRLQEVIDNPAIKAEEGDKIALEMAENHPGLREHNSIVKLMEKIADKHKTEEANRIAFESKEQLILDHVLSYREKKKEIDEALEVAGKALVGTEFSERMEKLRTLVSKARQDYQREQGDAYINLCDKISEQYLSFAEHCKKGNHKAAEAVADEIRSLDRQLSAIADVESQVKADKQYVLERIAGMQKLLDTARIFSEYQEAVGPLRRLVADVAKVVKNQEPIEIEDYRKNIQHTWEVLADWKEKLSDDALEAYRKDETEIEAAIKTLEDEGKSLREQEITIANFCSLKSQEDWERAIQKFLTTYPKSKYASILKRFRENELDKEQKTIQAMNWNPKATAERDTLLRASAKALSSLQKKAAEMAEQYRKAPVYLASFTQIKDQSVLDYYYTDSNQKWDSVTSLKTVRGVVIDQSFYQRTKQGQDILTVNYQNASQSNPLVTVGASSRKIKALVAYPLVANTTVVTDSYLPPHQYWLLNGAGANIMNYSPKVTTRAKHWTTLFNKDLSQLFSVPQNTDGQRCTYKNNVDAYKRLELFYELCTTVMAEMRDVLDPKSAFPQFSKQVAELYESQPQAFKLDWMTATQTNPDATKYLTNAMSQLEFKPFLIDIWDEIQKLTAKAAEHPVPCGVIISVGDEKSWSVFEEANVVGKRVWMFQEGKLNAIGMAEKSGMTCTLRPFEGELQLPNKPLILLYKR